MEQHFAEFERTQAIEQTADNSTNTHRIMDGYSEQSDGGSGTDGNAGEVYFEAAKHRRRQQDDEELLSERLQRSTASLEGQNSVGASGTESGFDGAHGYADGYDDQ